MPYIPQTSRKRLDPLIDPVKKAIHFPGELNYVITQIVREFLTELPGCTYEEIALMTGVLENVKQELYRRHAAKYEDGAIERNGDVY